MVNIVDSISNEEKTQPCYGETTALKEDKETGDGKDSDIRMEKVGRWITERFVSQNDEDNTESHRRPERWATW